MTIEELKKYRWKRLTKPIKEKRVCINCGKKKTFVYTLEDPKGGLWAKGIQFNLPFMRCPRCKTLSMVEVKK